MGSLMPAGSGPDKEIVTVLRNLFSGANFLHYPLRDHDNKKKKLFGAYSKAEIELHFREWRISKPRNDYPDDAKRKWFYFLHHLPKATRKAIKRILRDALTNNKIDGVRFSVEENAVVADAHLLPKQHRAATLII